MSFSLFILGAVFLCGIIPGVLFLVSLACTLGVVLIVSLVLGVDNVCVLFSCLFSSFSVAVSNILVSCSNYFSCLPVSILGSFSISFIVLVRVPAMRTALSIGVSCGTFTCFGYSLYCAAVQIPPVGGIWKVMLQ